MTGIVQDAGVLILWLHKGLHISLSAIFGSAIFSPKKCSNILNLKPLATKRQLVPNEINTRVFTHIGKEQHIYVSFNCSNLLDFCTSWLVSADPALYLTVSCSFFCVFLCICKYIYTWLHGLLVVLCGTLAYSLCSRLSFYSHVYHTPTNQHQIASTPAPNMRP